jgi:pyruvate dehydrogenase E1 component beta subunit
VSERLFGALLHPVRRVNTPAAPVPFSPPLEDAYLPSAPRIEHACRAAVGDMKL